MGKVGTNYSEQQTSKVAMHTTVSEEGYPEGTKERVGLGAAYQDFCDDNIASLVRND